MRRPDWPERLVAAIADARDRPFKWGDQDCALFAANAVRAMTGTDHAADFRGRYATRLGAARKLSPFGGLEGFVDQRGFTPVDPTYAQRGDVVLIDTDDGPALGICMGVDAVVVGTNGLRTMRMTACRRAWRVDG